MDATAAAFKEAAENLVTCEVCGRTRLTNHPCRFEIACACWYGIACDGRGTVAASMEWHRKNRAPRSFA